MKQLLLFLIIVSLNYFTSLAQVSQNQDEEKEKLHDDRIKNSHLNAFRDAETGKVDYSKLQAIHSFIDSKIQNHQKNARIGQTIPYIEWQERGPNNFAGRIQKIMYDPTDPLQKKVWAGSNSTGLFYNNDIEDPNSSWVATNMHVGPGGINDITYDPTNTQIFYVSASGGIYKSMDAGQTWNNINSAFRSYDLLVVSSTEMYAGSTGDGLKKSIDGGSNWTTILKPSANIGGAFVGTSSVNVNGVTSVERGADGTLYAAFGCGQVFKSSDNGSSWSNILAPTPSDGGNTLIALAPGTSGANQVLYVLCGRPDAFQTDPDRAWLKHSTNGGNSWIQKTWTLGNIQLYDNFVLKVHPTDPTMVFAGVNSLARSLNSGTTWNNLSPILASGFQHADWHDIHFKPSDPTKAIISHDQGVTYWTNVNNSSISGSTRYKDFIASQIHWGAMRQIANDNVFAANPQDQRLKILNGAGTASSSNSGQNNEGMWAKFDDDQPNLLLYTSMVSVHLYLKDLTANTDRCVTCGSPSLPSLSGWSTYFGGGNNASRDYDSQTNMAIAYHYMDSTVPGRVWFRRIMNISSTVSAATNQIVDFYIDGIFANNGTAGIYGEDILEWPITIKLGKTPNTLFIAGMSYITPASTGNYGGVLYKITNFLSANPTVTRLNPFSQTNTAGKFSSAPISIAIGANDDELFVPCFKSTTAETLFYTKNGGVTWKGFKGLGTAAQTGLPSFFSANHAIFNPLNYKQIILTTEAGVWTCDDISVPIPKWEITNAKFGKIPCRNIEIRPSDGTVMVATYGRGIFTAKLNPCQSNIVRTDIINGGILEIPSSTYIIGNAGNKIEVNGNVRYSAKDYVLLEPNFEVKKGGVFQAKIGGCN